MHLRWTSFAAPESVLAYDVERGAVSIAFGSGLHGDLLTEQAWVTSVDGTRLPVFLVHRPDITIANGPHPTWLYGYGGFRIPMGLVLGLRRPACGRGTVPNCACVLAAAQHAPGRHLPSGAGDDSDHDDRVVPSHSFTFAARLQEVSDGVALLRVDAASGHKEGRSHDALVAERSDVLCFLSRHTGLRWQ